MNEKEVRLLLAKAAGAYPSKAPDFKANPQILQIWIERLALIDPLLALDNLNSHIDCSNFFPDIADIVKKRKIDTSRQLRLQTEMHFMELEAWSGKDEPPPKNFWENVRAKIAGGET
jgi:hypothetical protein